MKANRNPFYAGTYNGIDTFWFDSQSRMDHARDFSIEECEAALQLDLQKCVRRQIESRLKKLRKQKGTA